MVKNKEGYPKLPKAFKTKFLEALRGKCYKFTRGDWFRLRKNKKTGETEYAHCTLGAAYHFATGENKGENGYLNPKVPEAFKDSGVRNIIMSMNDDASNRSFVKTAKWIEQNL
jgi:hypothetical protein